ncbi:putative transmembrane protein [Toxoplasma gondii TgCatPRC2]|uniref:Putative transmembrane protein n=2 Tax=Toxoplasma gondii TaxID=5811 RepID=A0A151HAL7_TOXGO|nr:putative transmembrane protein [Toxoplasma gondii TgCatPRC2]PIL99527.1 putative transmembrane protein [Toxoplasma gondii COUG]
MEVSTLTAESLGPPLQSLGEEDPAETLATEDSYLSNNYLRTRTETADTLRLSSDPVVPLEKRRRLRSRKTRQSKLRRRLAGALPRTAALILLATMFLLFVTGVKRMAGRVRSAEESPLEGLPATREDTKELVNQKLGQIEQLMLDDFYKRYLDINGGAARTALLNEMRRIKQTVYTPDVSDEMLGVALEQSKALEGEFRWKAARTEFAHMVAFAYPFPAGPDTPRLGRWFEEVVTSIGQDAARVVSAFENMSKYNAGEGLGRWQKAAAEAVAAKKWSDGILSNRKQK